MKRFKDILLLLLHMKMAMMFIEGAKRQELENETPSHHGKSFLLGFLEMDNYKGSSAIFVTSYLIGELKITIPFLNKTITRYTNPGQSTRIDLSTAIRMRGFGREGKGILLTANVTVSVYATNARKNSRDVYVIFPTSSLGTQHVVATYTPTNKSLVGIVALRDNTFVHIKLRLKGNITYMGKVYYNGDILRIFLDKLQTFQLRYIKDLTGTFVISSGPVVVIGGNICAKVPTNEPKCSHLATQLLPVSKWGTRFITSPIAWRSRGDQFKIIAGYDNTALSIRGKQNFTLNAGEYEEFSLESTESRYIVSNKPALLMQYNKGSAGRIRSEPFAVMVPPIEQYTKKYNLPIGVELVIPPFSNHISIIAKTSEWESLSFNASKFCRKNSTIQPKLGSSYTVYSCALRDLSVSTVFPISHTLKGGPFVAFMVGHTDRDGYGYLGGMETRDVNCQSLFPNGSTIGDMVDNDCDGRIDEETKNGVDDDGDGRIDEDTGNITCCNLTLAQAESLLPISEYLKGSEFNFTVTKKNCEALLTRTWSFERQNGTRAIAATQKIRWKKEKPTIILPKEIHLTQSNLSALKTLVHAISSLCPGDRLEFSDTLSIMENGTKLIQRQWTVQEECGRMTKAEQTIIVQSSSDVKCRNSHTKAALALILTTALGIPTILLITAACIYLAWKKHVSQKMTISVHIDVKARKVPEWNCTHPSTIQDRVYSQISKDLNHNSSREQVKEGSYIPRPSEVVHSQMPRGGLY